MSEPAPIEPATPEPASPEAEAAKPTRSKKDRWAHRKAEPRTLAFLWAMYILAAGLLTIGVLLFRGPWALLDKGVYQYAARTMLMCVALGLTMLWPMVRLSQSVPLRERSTSAVFKDLLVLLPPTQAVVWAQAAARAGWPPDLIGAMALSLVAWPMLVGAVLALVLRAKAGQNPDHVYDRGTVFVGGLGPGGPMRTLVMLGIAAASLLPLVALRTGPAWAAMLSPVSAVFDLSHPRPVGPDMPSVTDGRWAALLAQGCVALGAWVLLALIRPGPKPLRTPESGPPAAEPIASPSTPRGLGLPPSARGDRHSGTPLRARAGTQRARAHTGRAPDGLHDRRGEGEDQGPAG